MMGDNQIVEFVRRFMTSDIPDVDAHALTKDGNFLVKVDGKTGVGFEDTDQIFFFTGVTMGVSEDGRRYIDFQCEDYDLLVDLNDKNARVDALDAYEDPKKTEMVTLTDDEYDDIMKLVNDDSPADGTVVKFGNGYELSCREDEDYLILGGGNLYQEYDVLSIADHGIPYGGVMFELENYSLFFRNYNTVRRI